LAAEVCDRNHNSRKISSKRFTDGKKEETKRHVQIAEHNECNINKSMNDADMLLKESNGTKDNTNQSELKSSRRSRRTRKTLSYVESPYEEETSKKRKGKTMEKGVSKKKSRRITFMDVNKEGVQDLNVNIHSLNVNDSTKTNSKREEVVEHVEVVNSNNGSLDILGVENEIDRIPSEHKIAKSLSVKKRGRAKVREIMEASEEGKENKKLSEIYTRQLERNIGDDVSKGVVSKSSAKEQEGAGGRSKRTRKKVSYVEPSLGAKMRRS